MSQIWLADNLPGIYSHHIGFRCAGKMIYLELGAENSVTDETVTLLMDNPSFMSRLENGEVKFVVTVNPPVINVGDTSETVETKTETQLPVTDGEELTEDDLP